MYFRKKVRRNIFPTEYDIFNPVVNFYDYTCPFMRKNRRVYEATNQWHFPQINGGLLTDLTNLAKFYGRKVCYNNGNEKKRSLISY